DRVRRERRRPPNGTVVRAAREAERIRERVEAEVSREKVAESRAADVPHAAQIGTAADARDAHVAEDAAADDLGVDTANALERRPQADRFFARDVKGRAKRLAPRR